MPKHTQLKILIIGCLLLTAIVAQVNYASDSFKTSGIFAFALNLTPIEKIISRTAFGTASASAPLESIKLIHTSPSMLASPLATRMTRIHSIGRWALFSIKPCSALTEFMSGSNIRIWSSTPGNSLIHSRHRQFTGS